MIELKLNKESELSFDINIEGSDAEPKARLILEMEDNMELAISGNVQEGTVSVQVPSLLALKEKLKEDKVKGYLEVIVDNGYFIPWQEYFNLKEPITVQAEATQVSLKQKEIKITMGKNNFKEKSEIVQVKKNFQIPKTRMLLEKGDKFMILSKGDVGFDEAVKIEQSFTIPGTKTVISKESRLKFL